MLRISKEKNRVESARSPQGLEIPGNELRASKAKKDARRTLPFVTQHPALLPRVPGLARRGGGVSPPEKGFQQVPPFLHLDLKRALGHVDLGWGEGFTEGRGEKKHKNPSFMHLL